MDVSNYDIASAPCECSVSYKSDSKNRQRRISRAEKAHWEQHVESRSRIASLSSPGTYRRSGINNCGAGNQPRRSLKSLLLSCQKNRNESFDYSTKDPDLEEVGKVDDLHMALKRSSSVPNRVSFPLHDAVRNSDLKELGKLFKKKKRIDIDLKDEEGFSPLHRAAQLGFTEAVELLLAHGANVNLKSKTNLTPLYFAVQSGNFECASCLIEHGADESEIKDGFTDTKLPDFKGYSRTSRTRMSVHN